jgi:hypothetical protein
MCRPSYSIFVRFRKSRLALRRGIVRLEDACALADELRKNRFHNQDAVFVVREPEGVVVDPASGPDRAGNGGGPAPADDGCAVPAPCPDVERPR